MCGRYFRPGDKQAIAEAMHAEVDFEVFPSYNVAPGTFQPVIRLNHDSGRREAAMLWWGLIPFWAKDKKAGYSMINAGSETLAAKPAFREALKKRRCLVPATGFYEWKKSGPKAKQAYAIALKDGRMFAFAGLWERWKDGESGEQLESYTVVTTGANELMAGLAIHDRMPVILRPADYERWLLPGDPRQPPVDLLRPFDSELMTAWKVDARVGNARNNDAALCEPSPERTEQPGPGSSRKPGDQPDRQPSLFPSPPDGV